MNLFWIIPVNTEKFPHEIGVTSYDKIDAINLAQLAGAQVAAIDRILSLDDLEQNHIRLNMGNHMKRGIWYPLGFEHIV